MCDISPCIGIDSYNDQEEILNACYIKFKECFLNKKDRPKLFGREIIVPVGEWIECKAEIFWHVSSMSLEEKIDVLPCNNDAAMNKCDENCICHKRQITLTNGDIRDICYYRATKAFWVKELILFANRDDSSIKTWLKDNTQKKRTELYLRYQYRHIDYVAVFEDKPSGKYVFITAYPVFYINTKKAFDKDYKKYIKMGKA